MNIAILGSTGSIGKNALKVADNLKSSLRVYALSARKNIKLLYKQALKYSPSIVCVEDKG